MLRPTVLSHSCFLSRRDVYEVLTLLFEPNKERERKKEREKERKDRGLVNLPLARAREADACGREQMRPIGLVRPGSGGGAGRVFERR